MNGCTILKGAVRQTAKQREHGNERPDSWAQSGHNHTSPRSARAVTSKRFNRLTQAALEIQELRGNSAGKSDSDPGAAGSSESN